MVCDGMAETTITEFPGRISWKSALFLKKIVKKFEDMDLLERVYNTQFRSLFTAPVLQFSGTIEYALVTGLYFGSFPELNEEEFRDEETFLRYPWGKATFRATFKGLNKNMKHLSLSYYSKKEKTDDPYAPFAYNIYGFALALQVWTYEVIQSFVPKFFRKNQINDPLRTPKVVTPKVEGFTEGKVIKEDFDEDESEHEECTPPKPASRKRKAEGTLKEAVNLKRKLAYVSSPTRIPTPPSTTSSPWTPSVGVGCKCEELKEEVKELKIELKEELKVKDPEEFKEEKRKVDQNVEKNDDPKDVNVEEFEEEESKIDQNVEENEVKDVKVEEFEEEESKVDQNVEENEVVDQKEESKDEKMDVVDDDEKMNAVEDDEKMDDVDDLKLKVKDLKVKVKDEESVDVKVKKGIESKKVEDDNDDFKLYNTPPKGNFGRRVRKPKKDESYTNPSLSKLPKTNDPMKINPIQKFEDELLDKVKDWLDDPKTNDVKKDVATCVVGKDMFVRVLTRLTWLEDTEIDAFCYLLRKRIAEYPKSYKKSKVAIGDCVLAYRIRREHKKFSNDSAKYPVEEFKDYYMGAPHRNMPEWSTIDNIYLPVNINQKHWIMCVARLQKNRIDVYDCDAYLYKNMDPF
ncbi:uncharacterized protein LOC124936237 [Impatiens glandulifera]|uniref:uncharacterized protein LOC124936237 n=1 Tax=Impatiens glandulifera TaxID=253017 RepID=UPI001FB13557|nr:uncharacterized protein LOC124936237 [Impatiens glandulifera]